MEQPEAIQSLVSDTLNSNGQSGMLNMEEDNFEDLEEDKAEEPEEKGVSPWLILAIVLGSVILLLIAAVVVLILRRRSALKKRRQRIAAADPRTAVDLLFREALAMLFAAGIEKRNGSLDAYEEPLSHLDEGLGRRYAMVCALHRESRFSDHPFSAERKNVFELFRNETETFLRSRSKLKKRLPDQYIRHLY